MSLLSCRNYYKLAQRIALFNQWMKKLSSSSNEKVRKKKIKNYDYIPNNIINKINCVEVCWTSNNYNIMLNL